MTAKRLVPDLYTIPLGPVNAFLIDSDAASNMLGLGYSVGNEDLEECRRSLAKIAALDFEIACFGHGKAIAQGASSRFRQKWAT